MDLFIKVILSVTATIIAFNAWGLYLRARGQAAANEANMLKEGAVFAIDKNGRKIEYMCYGSDDVKAPVIINIHGSSMDAQFEKNVHQKACEELGVKGVSISLPGYGNTDLKIGRIVAQWPEEDLQAVLSKENIEKFYITGHSQGNPHAMAAAFIYPERVLGLGLNAPLLPLSLTKELGLKGALGSDSLPTLLPYIGGTWVGILLLCILQPALSVLG